ncbi:protein of unknown function (plasmid) [Pseudolactococcus piscium]|nr:protein of unknown function [Lactococcus piscium]
MVAVSSFIQCREEVYIMFKWLLASTKSNVKVPVERKCILCLNGY